MTDRKTVRGRTRPHSESPEPHSRTISILIADDHKLFCQGLRVLLESEHDLVVVGEAQDGRQAVKLVEQLRPDVVLMDIAMPHLNGIEAARQILCAFPDVHVVILSAHGDVEYIERTRELGASGYVHKESSLAELATGIRTAMQSGAWFQLLSSLSENGRSDRGPRARPDASQSPATRRLSQREMEILQLIAEGKANKQSATELGISIKTVEKHRQHVMDKLDIHDVAGLTRYAIAHGIIEGRDGGEDTGNGQGRQRGMG